MSKGVKKGDVVQLKSGGPLMTVVDVAPAGVRVVWFDLGQNLRNDTFDVDALLVVVK